MVGLKTTLQTHNSTRLALDSSQHRIHAWFMTNSYVDKSVYIAIYACFL